MFGSKQIFQFFLNLFLICFNFLRQTLKCWLYLRIICKKVRVNQIIRDIEQLRYLESASKKCRMESDIRLQD